MRFTLCAIGTRGDVAPFLALGRALVDRGAQVVVAAPPEYAADGDRAGLDYRPIARMMMPFLEEASAAMGSQRKLMAAVGRGLRVDLYDELEELLEHTRGSQALIATGMPYGPPQVAEALGIAYRFVGYCPQAYPSACHPPASGSNPARRSKIANVLAWRGLEWYFDRNVGPVINPWRRDRGLPLATHCYRQMVGLPGERFLAAAEKLAPLPPDVEGTIRVNTIRTLEADSLPGAVAEFLACGAPPVYVGFGSMPAAEAGRLLDIVLELTVALGVRAIVPAAWLAAANRTLPEGCLAVGEVPHSQLFPCLSAVVHHGGAGTTAAAARAGVPQVVVPHALDQYYWGHRVSVLGIGPRPLSYRRLSARTLAAALGQALGSGEIAENARSLPARLDGRDGAAELADMLVRDPSFRRAVAPRGA